MELELSPKSLRPAYAWRRLTNESVISPEIAKLTVFYVGTDDESPLLFESMFTAGMIIDTLSKSQQALKDLPRSQHPDVIILDLPFDKNNYRNFQEFLFQRRIISKTIVLQNDSKLTLDDLRYLKSGKLIDDTINGNTSVENLTRKIQFLKKVKMSLTKSKDDGLEKAHRQEKLFLKQTKQSIFKRTADIVFSSLILLVSLPVLLMIALAIRLDSPGPIIYNSRRAGRGFKIFRFYKFRTMVNGADKRIDEFAHLNQYNEPCSGDAKFVKIENDPRVTTVGKFLRNTSLDELPQLINVFKGDMSLVGNRPLPL